MDRDATIGLTTTVPVELIFGAGRRPLDLNNVFITSPTPGALIDDAERRGFPRNSCAWTKGVYATARALGLKRIVAVVQGDCSNTHAMAEVLRADGVEVVPFAYPYEGGERELLAGALRRFAAVLGTSVAEGEAWKERLDRVRALAHRVDALAWEENVVRGAEQHLWTISCSDFFGDPDRYAAAARDFIARAEARDPFAEDLRLGLLGVPPICGDLFGFLEERGARVVFNEVPRQFAMPGRAASLLDQYARYTYPYDIFGRIEDVRREIIRRRVDGVIHYVQSFCHRQIQDVVVRRELDVPVLTLESDRPAELDMRTATRLEAYLEMLNEGGRTKDKRRGGLTHAPGDPQ
jgi:benzoyl-CoA reductase/2-hydroxyglutaryl-CoA dehydratase subunit BcrC/BadD/HgdB